MLGDDFNQQLEYQAQQTFRNDDSGIVATDSRPIFIKTELPWKFDRNTRLNNLVVSNNVFILHLNEKTLQRRCPDETPKDTKGTSQYIEAQIPDAIDKLFLDPYGRLVVVSTRNQHDVYILASSKNSLKLNKKPVNFPNSSSFKLACVSWCNRFIQQPNEAVALFAGQDGSIYEILIRHDGELLSCNEVYPTFKSNIKAKTDNVTNIYCDVKSCYEENSNVFVVITTQSALYYFEHQINPSQKSNYFSTFFASFRDVGLAELKHLEFPSSAAQSEIQVFSKRKSQSVTTLVRHFAWITGAGLFYAEIDPNDVQSSFIQRHRIIDYYIDKSLKEKDEEKPPKSVALTEFHCLMMFPNENQIRAVCTVNQNIVMIDGYMGDGRPVCYARDQMCDQLWSCTEEKVLRYVVHDERRDVWRVFMQKKDFQKALETCVLADDRLETTRRQRAINSKYADHAFNEAKYTLSASIYAQSETSFEDVALKFFSLRDKEPLRTYLETVLQYQKPSTDSTQITILTLWLTDLYLNELDELRQKDVSSATTTNQSINTIQSIDDTDKRDPKVKLNEVRQKFQSFLRKPEIQPCLKEHRSAMYDLLTSHGDLDNLILFAEHVQDYERVILLYLEREDNQKALSTLELLNNHELLYKYSPKLIEKLPGNLTTLWKKKYNNNNFSPRELLPAMIAYSRAYPNGQSILEFLKFCLSHGCIDKSIHNYLLSEYAKFDPGQIMDYLENQKEDPLMITYDPRYALRLCIDHNLKRESVFLYRLLNMHEEAVDTALQVDVKLAKQCASTAMCNEERTKKLLLKIAGSVVTQGHNLNEVMEILDDCDKNLLKIEDILPLFSDFETIDQFKKPIIKSLDDYNERLSELRTDMDEASKSIDEIRDDLAKYRTRCVATIDYTATCSICEQALMLQSSFYIFACGHHFHSECLSTEFRRLMKRKDEHSIDEKNSSQKISKAGQTNEQNKQKVDRSSTKQTTSQKDIDRVNRLQSILASGIAPPSRDMESVQQELDDLVASQCVLCGEIAIDCIDQLLDGVL